MARLTKTIRSLSTWGLLLALLAPASRVDAQEPGSQSELPDRSDITVVLEGKARPRLRLALPDPLGLTDLDGEAATAADELYSTLRQDLTLSGAFEIQGPEQLSILEFSGDPESDYERYRSIGNELLLESTVVQEGDRLVIEGEVLHLESGRSVLGKRYRGRVSIARRIAHTFADEIVLAFTGRKGIALTSIAFQSDRGGEGSREIYLMDYDGHNQRPVTAHRTISMSPEWDPSGDNLVYISYLNRAGGPGVFLVDLRTGRKGSLITEGTFNASPAFSPDGRKIALARTVGSGNTEIFVCKRDGSDMRRLTNSSAIDTNPAWSPTGRDIAFTSNRAGSPQVYVMSTEGTDLRRITFEGSYNDGAVWSDDGSKIAHATRRRGGFDIGLTDLVTLESRVLTRSHGSHESPAYSPDGRKIAYASKRVSGGRSVTQIWVMDVDGTNQRQLTTDGNNLAPSWSRFSR